MNFTMNKYSILFVDDEEKALKYFSRLYSDDFDILTAPSVAVAKEILQEKADSIGVLITDQRMPEAKGVDLLEYARENHPHIVRLLTTAYSDLSDAIAAVNTGEIMRYITKPWDIDSLRLELTNAMQFFQLRRERDQLLHEKMNVWQRLVEVNRLRDLLVLAGGFTHLSNPLNAVASLLIKTDFSRSSNITKLQQLDTWDLLKQEIKDILNINDQLIRETFISDANTFTPQVFPEVLTKFENEPFVTIEADDEKSISANPELLEKLFNSTVSLIKNLSDEQGKINITLSSAADGINIRFYSEQADWRPVTLMTCPAELVISFLICHHHSGNIDISTDTGIQIDLFLPTEPSAKALALPDDEVLEEIFERYNTWQE